MNNHYFKNSKNLSDRPRQISHVYNGRKFLFWTNDGVFSKGKFDRGSEILLKYMLDYLGKTDLAVVGGKNISTAEFGGGYGALSIMALHGMQQMGLDPDHYIYEVNARACELSKNNLSENGVDAAVCEGDLLEIPEGALPHDLNLVFTNPPIRAGKQTVYGFFERAYEMLADGGAFCAVVRTKQGAASAEKKIAEIFGTCDIIGRGAGFKVLLASKNPQGSAKAPHGSAKAPQKNPQGLNRKI